MDRDLGPWRLAARTLLQKLRHPETLEVDPTGTALREALGTASVYDAVLTCAERSVRGADPRLAIILNRCDVHGDAMKEVARDFHVSLRHFFRFRLAMIDAFASEINRVLESHVGVPRDPDRADAMRALATAKFLLYRAAGGDFQAAIASAERALRKDPALAGAWCVISASNISLALGSAMEPDVAYDLAGRAIERADDLTPRSTNVRELKASLYWWSQRDAVRARFHAEEALEAPVAPRAHTTLAWIAVRDAQFEEAERHVNAAVASDPTVWTLHQTAAAFLHLRGDFARCAERCAELHAIQPEDPYVLGYYTEALNALGRYAETILVCDAAPPAAKNFSVMAALARAHAMIGDRARALRLARRFRGPGVSLAAIALSLGDEDRAWRALEESRDVHNGMLELVPYDPVFAPFWGERRLLDLLRAAAG